MPLSPGSLPATAPLPYPKAVVDVLRRVAAKRLQRTDRYWADPALILAGAGIQPDPWQTILLRSTANQIALLASRQIGKSTVSAGLALRVAMLEPQSLVLLLSPSLRQSGELFRKVTSIFNGIGRPVPVATETVLTLELANGSRIVSLPGTEGTVRGYSGVKLLVIDEAARVDDSLYYSVRPMLAVSGGQIVTLSTPFGKRGWFYEEWLGSGDWERYQVRADQCPRVTADFLEQERLALGERWYAQEYLCSFEEVAGAVFAHADIHAALTDDVQPMFTVNQ